MQQGLLTQVDVENATTSTTADVAAGATVLDVEDASEFVATGGSLTLGDEDDAILLEYVSVDIDEDQIVLVDELDDEWPTGTAVTPAPIVSETVAWVTTADNDIPLPAYVSHSLKSTTVFVEGPREPGMEETVVLEERAGRLTIVDVIGQVGGIPGDLILGPLPPGATAPTEEPADAPVLELSPFAPGGLVADWDSVDDARWYEVQATLASSFPPDDSATIGTSVTSTRYPFDRIQGEILPTGEGANPVRARVRAVNLLGAGPWSNEATATPTKADIAQLNVEQLGAHTALLFEAYIANLQTDIVTTSGRIVIGDEAAAHIVFDPALGALFFGPDGQTVLFKLDMTDQQLSEFTGKINASQLSVLNGLQLKGLLSSMVTNSRLTLMAQVSNPVSEPVLTAGTRTTPYAAPPNEYVEYAMSWDPTSSTWMQLLWRQSINRAIVRHIDPATGAQSGASVEFGNAIPGVPTGDSVAGLPVGVVRLGGTYYVLRRQTAYFVGGRPWALLTYGGGSSTVKTATAYVGVGIEKTDDDTSGQLPTLGTDGTRLVVASLNSDTFQFSSDMPGAEGRSGFLRYATDLTVYDYGRINGNLGTGLRARGCGIGTFAEYGGGTRFWVANSGYVGFFTFGSGWIVEDTVTPNFALEGSNVGFVGYNGTNFFSSTTGQTTLKQYSNYVETTSAHRTWWARYAWENAGLATLPSPVASITLPDRRYLTVTLPAPTDGTTTTRVFTGNGTTTPANSSMYSRGTTTNPSEQYSTKVTTGANPRTASDFTTGTPAEIVTQTGGLRIGGDGSFAAPKKMQAGRGITVPSGSGAVNVTTTFPVAFASPPAVVLTTNHPNISASARVTVETTTDFTSRFDRTAAGSYGFNYIAMLP